MRSAEELRAEVRRLRGAINDIGDPAVKQELAARALQLSQEAEAIARMGGDPRIVQANIDRYRRMLAAGIDDEVQKKIVEELLEYAEERLTEAGRQPWLGRFLSVRLIYVNVAFPRREREYL